MKKTVEEGCIFVDDILKQMVLCGKWKSLEDAKAYINKLVEYRQISISNNEITLV